MSQDIKEQAVSLLPEDYDDADKNGLRPRHWGRLYWLMIGVLSAWFGQLVVASYGGGNTNNHVKRSSRDPSLAASVLFFYRALQYLLPCVHCRRSYTSYISSSTASSSSASSSSSSAPRIDVAAYVRSGRTRELCYLLHNVVNCKLKRPLHPFASTTKDPNSLTSSHGQWPCHGDVLHLEAGQVADWLDRHDWLFWLWLFTLVFNYPADIRMLRAPSLFCAGGDEKADETREVHDDVTAADNNNRKEKKKTTVSCDPSLPLGYASNTRQFAELSARLQAYLTFFTLLKTWLPPESLLAQRWRQAFVSPRHTPTLGDFSSRSRLLSWLYDLYAACHDDGQERVLSLLEITEILHPMRSSSCPKRQPDCDQSKKAQE